MDSFNLHSQYHGRYWPVSSSSSSSSSSFNFISKQNKINFQISRDLNENIDTMDMQIEYKMKSPVTNAKLRRVLLGVTREAGRLSGWQRKLIGWQPQFNIETKYQQCILK